MKMILFISLYYFITSNIYISNAALTNATDGPKVAMEMACLLREPEFKDVLLSDCFVDKTLLIKDLLYGINRKSRFICITAPSGFGKTVNLKMLKTFLQPENGLISSSLTKGCSLFVKHNLNIFKWNNTFFSFHCGKYPVIFIIFKKAKGNSFNDVLDMFRDVISDSFLEHGYLMNSTRLDDNEKYRISLYTDRKFYKNVSELQLQEALGYLSEQLYLHYNKKVLVLIDDIDAPVWKLLATDFPIPDVIKTIYFIQNFMVSLLKDNEYVIGSVINDCTRLSNVLLRPSILIKRINFLGNHPYVKYYGLTDEEVKAKLYYFNILHTYRDVSAYYNGYSARGYYIYSTWSVLNYLETGDMKDYWITPDGFHNLSSAFLHTQVRKLVSQLLNGKIIEIGRLKEVSFPDVILLRDMMTSNMDFGYAEAERFLLFLTQNGYFNSVYPSFSNKIFLNIPNKQIHQHLYKQCFFANSSL